MNPPDWNSLLPRLLDFERSPGLYRVVLREPRPLFEHIGGVMLLATGRPVAGLPEATANAHELRRAARFFVRTVMLRPGSDPFTLLGLPPDFEPAQLREHYRLMIRLTHPDFCATAEGWPADAATRVNLAHDLLSSPQKRAAYAASMHTRPLLRRRLMRP
jgi:DnaJ domain